MQKWCTGWWKAEGEEALRQLDDILNAASAWQPAPALWGSAPSDGVHEPSAADDDDYELRHAPPESPADHLEAPMNPFQCCCALLDIHPRWQPPVQDGGHDSISDWRSRARPACACSAHPSQAQHAECRLSELPIAQIVGGVALRVLAACRG